MVNKHMIEIAEGWTAPTLRPPGSPPDPEPLPVPDMTMAELKDRLRNGTQDEINHVLLRTDAQRLVKQLVGVVK